MSSLSFLSSFAGLAQVLDRFANAPIASTAANVARHGRINFGVPGVRRMSQQSAGRHDLAALTITALRDIQMQPGRLDSAAELGSLEAFDGGDRQVDRFQRQLAGPYG